MPLRKKPAPNRKKATNQPEWLTVNQVIERAKQRGFEISQTGLLALARTRKKDLAGKITGTRSGTMFKQDVLDDILLAVPKKAIVPKGYASYTQFLEIARQRGILPGTENKFPNTAILLSRIPESEQKGVARDLFGPKHGYLVPIELAEKIMNKFEHKVRNPNIKKGKLRWEPIETLPGKTFRTEWKKMIMHTANNIINHIMRIENVGRKRAREILRKENYYAAREFGTLKLNPDKNKPDEYLMIGYSFRDRKYYWKKL